MKFQMNSLVYFASFGMAAFGLAINSSNAGTLPLPNKISGHVAGFAVKKLRVNVTGNLAYEMSLPTAVIDLNLDLKRQPDSESPELNHVLSAGILAIPESDLPLQNGYTFSRTSWNEQSRSRLRGEITYDNGLLTFSGQARSYDKQIFDLDVQIKIDPTLSNPRSLKLRVQSQKSKKASTRDVAEIYAQWTNPDDTTPLEIIPLTTSRVALMTCPQDSTCSRYALDIYAFSTQPTTYSGVQGDKACLEVSHLEGDKDFVAQNYKLRGRSGEGVAFYKVLQPLPPGVDGESAVGHGARVGYCWKPQGVSSLRKTYTLQIGRKYVANEFLIDAEERSDGSVDYTNPRLRSLGFGGDERDSQ